MENITSLLVLTPYFNSKHLFITHERYADAF